jgi:hypothetical protein
MSKLRLRGLGSPSCPVFDGLAHPRYSVLKGREDLVPLKDRAAPCFHKLLPVKLRLRVLIRQADQHSDQLAVHQH